MLPRSMPRRPGSIKQGATLRPSTYQHSLAIREKAFAPKHPDIAAAPDNLAVLHWAQGRDTEGEQRSIAITQKSTGIRAP